MTVIPFRPRQARRLAPNAPMPSIPELTRTCMRSAICIYLTPWLWWLDYLDEDNSSLWGRHDPRWRSGRD